MCGFCLHHLQPCYQYFLRLFPPRVISLPSVSLMNSRFLPPSFRPLSCFNLPLITLSSTSIFHWPNPPSLVATSLSLSPCHTLLMSLLSSHRYRFSILFISLTHCLSVTSSPYSTHVPSGIISSPYSSYVPPWIISSPYCAFVSHFLSLSAPVVMLAIKDASMEWPTDSHICVSFFVARHSKPKK